VESLNEQNKIEHPVYDESSEFPDCIRHIIRMFEFSGALNYVDNSILEEEPIP